MVQYPLRAIGFLAPDDGGDDVFVHISAVQRSGLETLNENEKVDFEVETAEDGRTRASKVVLGG